MKAVIAARVSEDTARRFKEIALLNNHDHSGTFLRAIIEQVVDGEDVPVGGVSELLKTQVGLTTKILFLTRFLANGVDEDETDTLLSSADEFLRKKGLMGPKPTEED